MNLLGTAPFDDGAAQAFVIQASAFSERLDWRNAVLNLESAALCASPALLDVIIETLGVFYIRANQYDKLSSLIGYAKDLTPSLAIGCLLLERNRQRGIGVTKASRYAQQELFALLMQFIADGRYTLPELSIVCSLMTQVGAANIAVPLLIAMLDMLLGEGRGDRGLDEELVTAVVTLALDRKMKRDAEVIVGKIGELGGSWPVRSRRMQILLGKLPLDSLPRGEDKVVDFLLSSGRRMGGQRGGYGH